jgi:tetratricopeptide (TPR) repeat protein
LELDPKDASALYYKGNAFVRLERYDEAIKCYGKALEIDPKNVNVLEWLKAKLFIKNNIEKK